MIKLITILFLSLIIVGCTPDEVVKTDERNQYIITVNKQTVNTNYPYLILEVTVKNGDKIETKNIEFAASEPVCYQFLSLGGTLELRLLSKDTDFATTPTVDLELNIFKVDKNTNETKRINNAPIMKDTSLPYIFGCGLN